MVRPFQFLAQALAYSLFAAVTGYFSASPAYTYSDPEHAQIKLSFSHPGQIKGECRRLSPEEIAQLAPNMRRPLDCPRQRLPVFVELVLDGRILHRELHSPTGLWEDGPSTVYRKFSVEAGKHQLVGRLRDSARAEGFDYERKVDIELAPQQNFVVDFRDETGGFLFL
jgi:hypothetical protein